jgi:hypothetical protein
VSARRLAACAVAVALFGAGCGGGSGVSPQASDQLTGAVARVRAAARAHDVVGANARLGDVRRMVTFLRARGDVSGAAAARILEAANEVAADLGLIPTTPTTTTTTTTTTPPPPPAPEKGKGHHGHGGGNGD